MKIKYVLVTMLALLVMGVATGCEFFTFNGENSLSEDSGEKQVVDAETWEAAIKKSIDNYTLIGRVFYDDWISDATICFESKTKMKVSLIGINSTIPGVGGEEYLEAGLIEKEGKYFEYWEASDTPISDLTEVVWKEYDALENAITFDFYGYYQLIMDSYSFEDFSYDSEIGAYITKNKEVQVWFNEDKLYKIKCENIKYSGAVFIYHAEILFGETKVNLPTMDIIEKE